MIAAQAYHGHEVLSLVATAISITAMINAKTMA